MKLHKIFSDDGKSLRTGQLIGPPRFKNPQRELQALGINVYGGGFTLGVLNHFHVRAHLEEIKLGCRTFSLNFPNIPRTLSNWKDWNVAEHEGKVDFVFANPPCVPWSAASSYAKRTGQIGTRKGKTIEHRFNDPLLDLTAHTMKTALRLRPTVFISESVENAYNLGEKHYHQFIRLWNKHGYHVTYFLTDAVLHGAPCKRRRFHFIAHKRELMLPKTPDPTRVKVVTVRDAIWDLRKTIFEDDGEFQHAELAMGKYDSPKFRRLLAKVPPLKTLRSVVPKDFKPKPSVFGRRLSWDMPSQTIMGFIHLIHPDGQRWCTYREGMRLMTYPDEFRIAGHNAVDAYDAVIPVIGDLLSRIAKRTIKEDVRVEPGHTVVDWRPLGVGLTGRQALVAREVA